MVMSRIDELSPRPGRGLRRVEVADLDAEVAAGALVVDIRPEHNRRTEGEMPGAVVDRPQRAGVAPRPDERPPPRWTRRPTGG